MSYVLIDGNSIGHAAANSPILHCDGEPVHAIFHSLKMIKRSLAELGGDYKKALVLWDGKNYWRQEEHPDYKVKAEPNTVKQKKAREESIAVTESYKIQRPAIIKALHLLGISQIVGNNHEADDIAGYLVRLYTGKGINVTMLSGDKDWLQLINSKSRWIDPIREREVTRANFEEFTTFPTPQAFVEGKALLGDKGDNIPGIDGIGAVAAPIIIKEFGSVQGLFDDYDSFEGEYETKGENVLPKSLSRYRKKINALCESGRDQFTWNIKMMNLLDVKLSMSDIQIVKGANDGKGDFKAFRRFCEDLQFKSIVRDIHAWEDTFGERL